MVSDPATYTHEELELLARRLTEEPRYRRLDLERLSDVQAITALARYEHGDLLRVARTGGGWSLGVVLDQSDEGRLRLVVRAQATGQISIKEQSEASVQKANLLRIGDYVQLGSTPFWVAGLDGEGELLVLSHGGRRVDPQELYTSIEAELRGRSRDTDQTLNLTPGEVARLRGVGPAAAPPASPMPLARASESQAYVPIEQLLTAEGHGLFAGNQETDTVYNLKSPVAGAALHTHKGHNYKAWNEDGAALFADARGRLFLGVFDQAGGEGSDANLRGAASAIAAQMMFEEMQVVAEQGGDDEATEAGLIRAAKRAHQAIIARGKGEVTTFVGAMVDHALALVVNVGDSGAQHYSGDGQHRASTQAQGIGRVLLEGLGMVRKPNFQHVTYRWRVSPGDYLVLGSDGLFDSKLPTQEIGQILAAAGNAADATRKLRDVVSARMKSRQGKPDNLTVVVVRVGDDRTVLDLLRGKTK